MVLQERRISPPRQEFCFSQLLTELTAVCKTSETDKALQWLQEIKAGHALNSSQTIDLAGVSISHMKLEDWHL